MHTCININLVVKDLTARTKSFITVNFFHKDN